jgi:hypothetical protein
VPAIFTIDIGDTPTVTFEAQSLREARELCREHWLKEDLAEAKSGGALLWDGKAKLRARLALPEETVLFAQAQNNGQPSDGLKANNLQQSWRFDWEPPKAVLRDVRTIDWISGRLKSSAQADPVAGRLVLGFGCRLGSLLRPDRRS